MNPTSGVKTSEFWVTVGSVLPLILNLIPPQYAPYVAAVGGVYTIARTLLKAVQAQGYAKNVPDLPSIPVQSQSQGEQK